MQEILISGRGGQGAQTAGNLLARAFFAEGSHVQTFATYGGARRGTPVSASIRVDDRPIRLRCNIERACAILCFDDSLLDPGLLACAHGDTLIVVNSRRTREAFSGIVKSRVVTVDGLGIARKHDMGKVVNSALLGAFVAVLNRPGIETMCQVVEQTAPVKRQENAAACREGFQRMRGIFQAGPSQ